MATRTDNDPRERSIGELLKQLAQETNTLVRQEFELAKAEMAQRDAEPDPGSAWSGRPARSASLRLVL